MLTSYLLQKGVHVEHYGYALLVAVVILHCQRNC
ncbi:MAG: hypothetical protein U5K54_14180 [Cytophagales bacterium]|nr:hypothetical protein [Cytophagales bacterium]